MSGPALLALDFDGVISDSAPEAFAVALRTFVRLRPDSPLRPPRSAWLEGRAPDPDVVASDPGYAPFLELMPLGNRAEDFGIALCALEAGRDLPDQSAYDAFRAELPRPFLREYHATFYRERAAMSEADRERWLALVAPYPELIDLLRRRRGDVTLAVATAKDRRSVHSLLAHYGIDDLFDAELVLDKDTGVRKSAHIEHLHRSRGVAFPRITFVDDKVSHLDEVARLGVRCGLATWGFNGEREISQARARGHLVCTLEGLESQLFD